MRLANPWARQHGWMVSEKNTCRSIAGRNRLWERSEGRLNVTSDKIFMMPFQKVFPLLIAKAEKKGRTRDEVFEVASWLTGYSYAQLASFLESDLAYGAFFENAPHLNENRKKITGSVCGVKLSEIEDELMLEIRYLDKLVDELAKGKAMEKIFRK